MIYNNRRSYSIFHNRYYTHKEAAVAAANYLAWGSKIAEDKCIYMYVCMCVCMYVCMYVCNVM